MSELQLPLMLKVTGSGSPGDPVSMQPEAKIDPLLSTEDRFRKVLEELEANFPATVKKFESSVKCSCSCRLGVVLGIEDGSIFLMNYEAEVQILGKHEQGVQCLCAAGNLVVSGSKDCTVRIWSLEERTELGVFIGHSNWVNGVSIATDGRYIVSGSLDKTVRIWDATERKQLSILEGHTEGVRCVAISPDGKYIVSDGEKTIRIWGVADKKEVAVLEGHTFGVCCVSISSDGKHIFSGSNDKTVRIWDLQDKKELAVHEGHTSTVSCLSISSDGKRFVSGSNDKTVRIWDLDEEIQLAVLEGHTGYVNCVSISSDGKHILSGAGDNTVRIWDLEEEKLLSVLEGHTSYVVCVSLSSDGKYIVSGSIDKTVRIWDFEEEKQLAILEGHSTRVRSVAISSDGKYIVSGSADKTVRIWDLEGRRELGVLEHTDGVYCVAMSTDGKYVVSGTNDHKVCIWDFRRKTLLATLEGHNNIVWCVAISSDGQHIVSGSWDKTVRIWDLEGRKQLVVLEGHSSNVYSVSISSDGKYILSGAGDNTVRIWDLEEGKQLSVLEGHTSDVMCVSMSSDGKHIVSGSKDRTVRIWDFAEKKQLAILEGHTSDVMCVTITADGKHVVSGSYDKTIRIFDLTMIIPTLRSEFLRTNFDKKEPSPSRPYYSCGIFHQNLKQGIPIASSVASRPILPHYFNSLHICAYYNQFSALKDYLGKGVPIIRGVFGSPLTVALIKKSMKCIDVILEYLISQFEKNQRFLVLQDIVADFPQLLLSNASTRVPFFSTLLGPPTQSLPDFIVPLRELPSTLFQIPQLINLSDFAQFKGEELLTQNGEIVKFLISRFNWNFALGSAQSLEFLRALEDCGDKHILTTPLAISLIEAKWKELLFITQTHTLLYVCSLLCLGCLTFNFWRSDVFSLVFLCLNVLFLLYELVQSLANGSDYWVDPWNYVDLIRGLSSVTWGYLMFSKLEEWPYLLFLVVSVCFLRGFTFFRTFKITRVFVRMVIEVVKEMYAFLVILAYTTISFGMMYAVLMPEQITSASEAWTTAYELLMGTHDETDFDLLKWLCFTLASLMNVIIMLNLLISILGDAYHKAQISASENDNLEMLKLVIEYESMFFWRRKIGKPCVMIVCKSSEEDDAVDEWAGRVNNIKKALENNLTTMKVKLEGNLKETRTAVEGKLTAMEGKFTAMEGKLTAVEGKLTAVEGKLDQILAAFQAPH